MVLITGFFQPLQCLFIELKHNVATEPRVETMHGLNNIDFPQEDFQRFFSLQSGNFTTGERKSLILITKFSLWLQAPGVPSSPQQYQELHQNELPSPGEKSHLLSQYTTLSLGITCLGTTMLLSASLSKAYKILIQHHIT